mmetsp:Transcript_12233/g.22691  ORF Transcript_12233/g.22691 Transcript_12233/m.22691 type:complete len:621 (+) Transcript_12233:55-1917(+)
MSESRGRLTARSRMKTRPGSRAAAGVGGMRIPVVLALFVVGLTALGALQILLSWSGHMRGSHGSWASQAVANVHWQENPARHEELALGLPQEGSNSRRKRPIAKGWELEEDEDEYDEQEQDQDKQKRLRQSRAPASDSESNRNKNSFANNEMDEDEDENEDEDEDEHENENENEDEDEDESSGNYNEQVQTRNQAQENERIRASQDAQLELVSSSSSVRKLVPQAQIFPRKPKSFVYFKSSCSYLCKLLTRNGYKLMPGLGYGHELTMISYKSLNKYRTIKKSALNQIESGSSCIGGGKGKQLKCKVDYVHSYGCEYQDLGIQPAQWDLRFPELCREFFEEASKPENEEQIWILKPGGSFHGAGIKLYSGISELREKYPCTSMLMDGIIAQRYVDKPALFSGHKFDFRTYMLVASMDPYIVFYHDGFVRKSEHAYSTDSSTLSDTKSHITNSRDQSSQNHFYSLEQLQERLTEESGFAPDFVEKVLRPHTQRTTNFMFHSAREKFAHRVGRYQLFALDWMLGADGKLFLLEANGNPQVSAYPGTGLTPGIWTSMVDLVHKVQTAPEELPDDFSVAGKYKLGNWSLVFNELEEQSGEERYNPCKFNEYGEQSHPNFGFAPE